MDVVQCRACAQPKGKYLFNAKLIDLDVRYYECENCGYVFTEEPYWLDRAYSDVMNLSDTGIMYRNLANVRIVITTLFLLNKLKGRIVDYAGGYGILVRLLRDYGIDAYWTDVYADNLLARGFEYEGGHTDLATAFEVFEHLTEPGKDLNKLLSIAPNILFTTRIIPEPIPKPGEWWYYGLENGQHVGFYKIKTLKMLAEKTGKYFVSDGCRYHLFTEHKINSKLWLAALRAKRLITLYGKMRLKSKTWPDHLQMSARK